jgi:hypothetical protein
LQESLSEEASAQVREGQPFFTHKHAGLICKNLSKCTLKGCPRARAHTHTYTHTHTHTHTHTYTH